MHWTTVQDNHIALQFPCGGTDSLRVVFDPAGGDIAYVLSDCRDNGNSNALLIAAAPDLFAACMRMLDAVFNAQQSELPDEILMAAFVCQRALVKAGVGKCLTSNPEQRIAQKRREQNRLAQKRCRAKKKAAKEATDGR